MPWPGLPPGRAILSRGSHYLQNVLDRFLVLIRLASYSMVVADKALCESLMLTGKASFLLSVLQIIRLVGYLTVHPRINFLLVFLTLAQSVELRLLYTPWFL